MSPWNCRTSGSATGCSTPGGGGAGSYRSPQAPSAPWKAAKQKLKARAAVNNAFGIKGGGLAKLKPLAQLQQAAQQLASARGLKLGSARGGGGPPSVRAAGGRESHRGGRRPRRPPRRGAPRT